MLTWFSLLLGQSLTTGFLVPQPIKAFGPTDCTALYLAKSVIEDSGLEEIPNNYANQRRRFFSALAGGALLLSGYPGVSNAQEEESFASIAARAAQLSSEVGEKTTTVAQKSDDPRTAYDFSLPVAGETLQFSDIVHQQYDSEGRAKVKAVLVVNMKEDDPVARKDIPEFISLASK